jgi:hypothetical protein
LAIDFERYGHAHAIAIHGTGKVYLQMGVSSTAKLLSLSQPGFCLGARNKQHDPLLRTRSFLRKAADGEQKGVVAGTCGSTCVDCTKHSGHPSFVVLPLPACVGTESSRYLNEGGSVSSSLLKAVRRDRSALAVSRGRLVAAHRVLS